MTNFVSTLFLGIPKTEEMALKLKSINPALLQTFMGEGYLEEVEHLETCYMGKQVGQLADLKTLDNLEGNVLSLVKKLLPDFPLDRSSVKLIAIYTQ